MEQKKELKTVYDTAKSFYKKAYYTEEVKEGVKVIRLYSYNTLVLTIIIKLNDISKSYYICNEYTAYSKTTLRHTKELIHQFMTLKMNVYNILNYEGFTKNNIIRFHRYSKTLNEYLASKECV